MPVHLMGGVSLLRDDVDELTYNGPLNAIHEMV
jgi:hypothetical protein